MLEPSGLDRGDGKRPVGIAVYPYSPGRCLIWDATCVNTFASSNIIRAALAAGSVADAAEVKKIAKYAEFGRSFIFQLVTVETSGTMGSFIFQLVTVETSGTMGSFIFQLVTVETSGTMGSFIFQLVTVETSGTMGSFIFQLVTVETSGTMGSFIFQLVTVETSGTMGSFIF